MSCKRRYKEAIIFTDVRNIKVKYYQIFFRTTNERRLICTKLELNLNLNKIQNTGFERVNYIFVLKIFGLRVYGIQPGVNPRTPLIEPEYLIVYIFRNDSFKKFAYTRQKR